MVMALVYLTTTACASETPPARNAEAPAAARAQAPVGDERVVVFLGDSLTAGFGLAGDQAFPALVGQALTGAGLKVRIVNAGVSGDTTGGALDRLDWLLKQKPDVLVVGLGANDAFRGQPPSRIEANLREIVRRAKRSGARVVLLGMRIPTNYGPDYTQAFHDVYARVATSENVQLMPFLLEGVGGRNELNLDDGIHPNAEGQQIVAAGVLPYVLRALGESR
jgi:acyl-CoA thioesterase I